MHECAVSQDSNDAAVMHWGLNDTYILHWQEKSVPVPDTVAFWNTEMAALLHFETES